VTPPNSKPPAPPPDRTISAEAVERPPPLTTPLASGISQECYERWSAKGAEFLTPPIRSGAEIRCYMREPDGYMIEVGQATGLLTGELAKKRA
jgi:hypothetical protein